MSEDMVNHPPHYTDGGIETIDYMKAKMPPEQFEGYLIGNVLKYVSRYGKKNGVQDLEKARWYLDKAISLYKQYEITPKQYEILTPNSDSIINDPRR